MKYDDIINLSRPISKKHLPMSLQDRAAQFAPFSALTGHYSSLAETARVTERKIEPDELQKELINRKLTEACSENGSLKEIAITYFVKDLKKEGGEYVTVRGKIKKIDSLERNIVLDSGIIIEIDCIINAE